MSLLDAIDSLGAAYQVTRGTTAFEIIAVAEPTGGGYKLRTKTRLETNDLVEIDRRPWRIVRAAPWKADDETYYECDAVAG